VLLLTACGPVGDGDDSGISGSGGAVRDGGTITVALADDPDMLDPTLARTLVGRMVFMSMCEKLYDIDQKLNVVPQLAASPPGMVMSPQAARRARRRLRQFRTIELLAPRPVKSAADNFMRSLPDIWSHEAEPEPTPDYHQAADAYMGRCTGRPRRSRLTCHLVCEVYGRRVVELRDLNP
jgi:hypothetical protein